MECPKCGAQQNDAEQCVSCGIYFAKYEQQLEQKNADNAINVNLTSAPKKGRKLVVMSSLIIALGGGVYLATKADVEDSPTKAAVAENQLTIKESAISKPFKNSIRQQLELSHVPKNAIERARNATVFIQTDWGTSGSGYIADADCRVITNRHVVEFDQAAQVKKALESTEMRRAYITQQQEIITKINRKNIIARQEYMMNGATQTGQNLRQDIDRLQQELLDLPQTMTLRAEKEARDAAWKHKLSKLRVSLVDGTEYSVARVKLADTYDLATFHLNAEDCPFLIEGDVKGLAQGSRLFSIGNPSGLTYTVTSGVFSGFRTEGSESYLQTDAPINPGNSGGPLVDNNGRVIGINTMILRNAQNIGFAIPVTAIPVGF